MIKKMTIRLVRYFEEYNILNVHDLAKVSNSLFIRGATLWGSVEVCMDANISRGVRIDGEVKIGRFTSINGPNTDIVSKINRVEIGNFCSIARNVTIQEFNHHSDRLTSYYIFQNVF